MCAPDIPTPPSPRETSAASTSTNVGTAIANAMMGNVNQVTPDGSLTYNQSGTYNWADPYTGQSYAIPQFTATQTLSPQGQAIADQTSSAKLNLSTLANNQSAFLNDYMAKPIDLSTGNVEKYINDHFSDDFNRQWGDQESSLMTRLANQGIGAGSEAYDRALSQFSDRRSNAYDNMYGNQYQGAVSNIMAERNQPINEITALLSGSQVSNPNYVNTSMPSIPTTDVAGLINTNYDQQVNKAMAEYQANQGILGGLFGLGGKLIGLSDARLKTDVRRVGTLDNGLGVYAYRYLDGGEMHIGVMAQEVEATTPEAVVTIGGFKVVDYEKAVI